MELKKIKTKVDILMFIIIISTASCRNKTYIEIAPDYYANLKVDFHLVDSTILKGNKDSVFALLQPVTIVKNGNHICFDLMTKKIFEFKSYGGKDFFIENIHNINSSFEKHKGFVSNMIGVVSIDSTKYLLISEPYSLLVDKSFKLIKKISSNVNSKKRIYYRSGNINHIIYNSNRNSVFFPVLPDLPANHEDYFEEGRIVEIDLVNDIAHLLPLGLPPDYQQGKEYQLFSIPIISILGETLYYIYPGSNYLFAYNLQTNNLKGIKIKPQYVNEMFTKEIGSQMGDAFFSIFECNNYYRMMTVDQNLYLFYWKGKNRNSNNGRIAFNQLDCYVLAYSPKNNEVLFDVPLNIKGVNKNPAFTKNGILYFLKDQDFTKDEFTSIYNNFRIE